MTRYTWRTGLLEVVMLAVTAVFVFPLWLLVSVGFRSSAEVAQNPLAAPTRFDLSNFKLAWEQGQLGSAFLNSIYIVVVTVAALVVVGACAGYYFARAGTGGRRWYGIVAAGMMVPFQIGVLPLYRTFSALGISANPVSVIIFNIGIQLPLTIILYTGFIRQVPLEYEEAARVDGAGTVQVFRRVILPLLLPVTGTVIVLDGLAVWNEFFTPLLYLGGTPNVTVPVQIYGFVGEYSSNWGEIFAGLLMASLPVLVLFFVFQRYMIRSFGSGLKG
ncbi:carbohydrate ABC transporter permease [Amycolatopsis sacchari]|uniref:Raffinose/stachyose/melibiose transport system permease protein n=1 Tax=Amycolatopsis sacchari TaxID=115433 RepID=A0A1I4DMB6_9PSEU|nr:carbohydrate ABC transporter permease [Amycolatopsis sacchari]SFK93176.1 raffinose/stachyose/melibiose transport system permease protein [Amycolatopsis sacchari]